jgi:hypothetical protein
MIGREYSQYILFLFKLKNINKLAKTPVFLAISALRLKYN